MVPAKKRPDGFIMMPKTVEAPAKDNEAGCKRTPARIVFTVENRETPSGEKKWCLCYLGREAKVGDDDRIWFDTKEELLASLNKIEMDPGEYRIAA